MYGSPGKWNFDRGYYPRLDTANLRTLEFAVSDGKATWAESKDMRHSLERVNSDALLYRQTSSDPGGKFKIEKTYASDSQRDALLIEVVFTAPAGYELYVLADPALKNSGYGDTGFTQDGALVTQKETWPARSRVRRDFRRRAAALWERATDTRICCCTTI